MRVVSAEELAQMRARVIIQTGGNVAEAERLLKLALVIAELDETTRRRIVDAMGPPTTMALPPMPLAA